MSLKEAVKTFHDVTLRVIQIRNLGNFSSDEKYHFGRIP